MKVVLIILMCFMITACAGIRKFTVEMSEEDMKNTETSRIVAKNLLSTWPINSGFIRAALGPAGLSKLPADAVLAMDELDKLASQTSWTDFELGESLGLRVRLLTDIIRATIDQYAPELISYLPTMLLW